MLWSNLDLVSVGRNLAGGVSHEWDHRSRARRGWGSKTGAPALKDTGGKIHPPPPTNPGKGDSRPVIPAPRRLPASAGSKGGLGLGQVIEKAVFGIRRTLGREQVYILNRAPGKGAPNKWARPRLPVERLFDITVRND